MLAEAVCKLEGFTYAPSQERFWLHGYSTETDFIFVTTQTLTIGFRSGVPGRIRPPGLLNRSQTKTPQIGRY